MSIPSETHLFGAGPKRILSLDGGGTRGIIELAFLEQIERVLRAAHPHDADFLLCDHFDLIGGTSTGAIIAACLALGMSVPEVRNKYLALGSTVFKARRWRIPGLAPRFDAGPLTSLLADVFGDRTMESKDLLTGFAAMARRFATGSPWLISNNSRAPYWLDPSDRSYIGNRHYRLADVVRASTAAPGFFSPLLLSIAEGEPHCLFIDGGLSPYNNPSLALLMLTQARAFGLQWKMGIEHLSLISIGTGNARGRSTVEGRPPRTSGGLALSALMDTLDDGQLLTLTLLQWFSESPMPWPINSEIGDLSGEVLGGIPLLRFQRYDMPLNAVWLENNLNMEIPEARLNSLRRMDHFASMEELYQMAKKAAELQVRPEHL